MPLCMVAHELRSGRWIRKWLQGKSVGALDLGPNAALVAYLASAEIGCFLQLGWRLPRLVLDLYVEHRVATNGLPLFRHGLLDALRFHGLAHGIDALEKEEMRALAMRGGPYTEDERQALLVYCETDVVALSKLLPAMLPELDLDRALMRGSYMVEVARMERHGVPVDAERLEKFLHRWGDVQAQIGRLANARYGTLFKGGISFSQRRFQEYLDRRKMSWPRTESGRLDLKDDTFSTMAKARPELKQLREARKILSRMRLNGFAVGEDGANRAMLSPFRAKTGRNQPSNSKFLMGASAWLRHFVKPTEGRAVAYIDYSQQEFAVAAALSGDKAMLASYESGDPYMSFAVACGAAPHWASKVTHANVREVYKVVVLATLYGMGVMALSEALGIQPANAEGLLRQLRKTYPDYWRWSDRVQTTAKLTRRQKTCLGWEIKYPPVDVSDPAMVRWLLAKEARTMRNWPVQATGADILRVAVQLGGQRGVRICAPVHDAVLIEDSADRVDTVTATMRRSMSEAARLVAGVDVRTDVEIVRWPDRYREDKGAETWEQLCRILNLEP